MTRLNWIFTLTSLTVVLVTVERFSFTTHILLQPDNFLRLHELLQMTLIILVTVVLPVFLLRMVSRNFMALQSRVGWALFVIFIVGIYYYSTGNGLHEVASFTLNTYCDVDHPSGNLCRGLFVNDFFVGNIFFFVGGFLMTASLLLIERMNPSNAIGARDVRVMVINAIIYASTVLAYAGFDRVVVGLVYSILMEIFTLGLFLGIRKEWRRFPFITYTTIVYTIGSVTALLARLVH